MTVTCCEFNVEDYPYYALIVSEPPDMEDWFNHFLDMYESYVSELSEERDAFPAPKLLSMGEGFLLYSKNVSAETPLGMLPELCSDFLDAESPLKLVDHSLI